jgi:TRAP-type C4-dicarboxylate transport system permease small subunit
VKPEIKEGQSIVARMNDFLDKTINSFAFMAGLVMVFIMGCVTAQIICRYFFEKPIVWTTEVTEYCLLWITFLATAWVLMKEKHVVVDLIPNMLKLKTKTMLYFGLSIIGIIICFIYTWYATGVTIHLFQTGRMLSTVLEPPAYVLFLIIPLGNLLLTLQFVRRTRGFWEKLRTL